MSTLSRDFTIDLRRLRVLRMLDQHGTVSAAATALHLTPSAVSQQIAGLARDTGVQLLEKRGRGVRLTARARRLLEHAAVIEQQLQVARADLASWDAGEAGHVGIASLSTGITAIVAPALKSLRCSHPGLSVTVSEAEPPQLFTDLDLGDVDVALTVHHTPGPPVTDPRYHRVDLLVDPLDAVLPADHPAAQPEGVRLADLADQPWVSGYPGGSCARLTEAVCANAGFTPDVRHHVGDWVALGALVASGAGVALVPRVAQPLPMPGLAVVPVLGTPAARHFYAAVRAGSEADPAVALVLDRLTEVAAEWTARAQQPTSLAAR
ncbi:MAG: LysR family transcriptional regulator [Angustibacter sp.]